jgi:hypothetical protein
MKTKKFLLSFFLLLFCVLAFGQKKVENLGLVSELVYIKYCSEAVMIRYKDNVQIRGEYNNLRINLDQVLLQLKADIQSANCLKYYRKLDRILRKNSINSFDCNTISNRRVRSYVKGLQVVNDDFDSLKKKQSSTYDDLLKIDKGVISDITSAETILSSALSIIKSYEDIKKDKVNFVCSTLDSLRLSSVSELTKKK